MNRLKRALFILSLVVMAVCGLMLHHVKTHQRLGVPGIKATPLPGEVVMKIDLPDTIAGFTSTNLTEDAATTNMLPSDTSYAKRLYAESTNLWVAANVVLMGKDRTSIHKPEYCLPGQGWSILSKTNVDIPIASPTPYTLTVAKWVVSNTIKNEHGQPQQLRGIYTFWFVADNETATTHMQRMKLLARDLIFSGVLQRWAYVSYFTLCLPGQEDAVFAQVEKLIAASVPEFQLPPRAPDDDAVAHR